MLRAKGEDLKASRLCRGTNNSYAANVVVTGQGTLGGNIGILNSGSMTENHRKKRGTGDIPGKPSRPWRSDARVCVSVQKRLSQTGPSDETGSSSKKKKNKWTEEDMELKAVVQKCSEGNWASILKQDFKHNRTASQLSRTWSTIRKNEPDLMPGGSKSSHSDECVATNKATTLALDMPMLRSASAIFPGATQSNTQVCSTLFSASKPPLPPTRSREPSVLATPQKEASNPQKRPRTKKQIDPVMPSDPPLLPSTCPKSSIQEVVAAGGRIATPSTATSLLRAAQSRAVPVIPAGGAFVRADGQSLLGTNMLPLGGNLSGKGRMVHPIEKPLHAPPRTGSGRPGIASPSTQLETKTGAQILKRQETAAAKIDRMTSEMHVDELLKMDYGGTDGMGLRCPTSYGGQKGQSLYRGTNNSYAANVAVTSRGTEEINLKVDERTEMMWLELRMTEEMILQQKKELASLRKRLEEIECDWDQCEIDRDGSLNSHLSDVQRVVGAVLLKLPGKVSLSTVFEEDAEGDIRESTDEDEVDIREIDWDQCNMDVFEEDAEGDIRESTNEDEVDKEVVEESIRRLGRTVEGPLWSSNFKGERSDGPCNQATKLQQSAEGTSSLFASDQEGIAASRS